MTYARRIKELRQQRGLTQRELSAIVKVDFRTVSCWENERVEPNIRQLFAMAKYFDVTIDYLLGYTDIC